jgi:hypothetical protein
MNHQFDELTKSLAQSVTRRAVLKKFGIGLAGMALGGLAFATATLAGPTFNSIDYPGASATFATDINASGQICGVFFDSSGAVNGFLLSQGNLSPIKVPGSAFTAALGINRNGDIVGM